MYRRRIEMVFQAASLTDLARRCRVHREQLWPQRRTLGNNNERKTPGCQLPVLDGDRVGPILLR